MSSIKISEYGSWKSVITSDVATSSSLEFQELHLDSNPHRHYIVYWSELRYDEGGRYVICSSTDTGVKDVMPADFNARTRVHEYGGGAFFVHNGDVFSSSFKDQKLFVKRSSENTPQALISAGDDLRFADGYVCEKNELIYIVCEDHGVVNREEAKEAKNSIVCVDVKSGQLTTIAEGCDFYSSPRASKDGTQLAWIQWNHPNMPWDTTELCVAKLNTTGDAVVDGSVKKITEGTSLQHPRWSQDSDLFYLSDTVTGWNNLWVMKKDGTLQNMLQKEAELGSPHWVFAYYTYDIDPTGSGNIALCETDAIGIVNYKTGKYEQLQTGFCNHSLIQYGSGGNIYCKAGSPTKFPCIIRVNTQSKKVDILRESKKLKIDSSNFSIPEKISWPTGNSGMAHGFFYPPKNPGFAAPEGTLPPLLVKAHGGPTDNAKTDLDLKVQYFTSRGFAVLDVDYRGSTGYGKEYRNKLLGKWGIYDVEDCSSGALYLANQGKVDRNKLCIDGGSAGGFTTLACLAMTDVFHAGASHYGIADLDILARETHKFESRYLDSLIAPYDDEHKHIYEERSPISHIDKFNCPIAFFQGDEDKIVPPNQTEMMYNALTEKGLMCAYVLFEGEQHGFRNAENIQAALDGEFYFFSEVLGFEPADN